MDVRRFLDLYTSEAHEHVRLLQRSLLELERDAPGDAVEAAFRAAHTLKGISAAMGFGGVAEQAHTLEDRLAEMRSGTLAVTPVLIDELLAAADELDDAIGAAVAGGSDAGRTAVTNAAAPAGGPLSRPAEPPPGSAAVVRVRLRSDTPLPSVRALLVLRALEGRAPVVGSDPPDFGDDFDGSFLIFLGPDADPDAVRAAIAGAGDIHSVEITAHPSGHGSAAAAGRATAQAVAPARIRVDASRLDTIGEAVAEASVLFTRLAAVERSGTDAELLDRMGVVLAGLQQDVLQLRMAPIGLALERLPRAVRDAARHLERDVELAITGDDVELDRAIIEELGEPLMHLVRNAVDHGIEPPAERIAAGKPAHGQIRLHAARERSSVSVTISDDGRGVDAERVLAKAAAAGQARPDGTPAGDEELFRILSQPGMTTAESVTAVSGRGVGLDVVASRIRTLGGAISMRTIPGTGTSFTVRLPITLALAQALRVRVGGEDYVIPLTHIAEVVDLNGSGAAETVDVRGERVPLVRLRRTLQLGGTGAEQTAIVAAMGERRAALAVDELVGREQVLVKPIQAVQGMLPYFSGAALLADGRPALVLDPLSVM